MVDAAFWINPGLGGESWEDASNWSTGQVPIDGLAIDAEGGTGGEIAAINVGLDNLTIWMDYQVPGTNALDRELWVGRRGERCRPS